MTSLLARLLGIDPPDTLQAWSLHIRSDWLVLLGALFLLAAAGAGLMYFRQSGLSRRARAVLALVRALAAAVLLAMLARPVVEARISRPVRPAVLVLVDESDSMGIRDTRKDVADLAEAAMALGRLPYDPPELPRAAARAQATMEAAAAAMEVGGGEAAAEALEQAARALRDVRAVSEAPPRTGTSAERRGMSPLRLVRGEESPGQYPEAMLAALGAIESRQAAIHRELEAGKGNPLAAAARQRQLAADLADWRRQALNAGLSLPEWLTAELALVSRRDLLRAALVDTARPVFEGLAQRAQVRYFRFADRCEETAAPGRAMVGPAQSSSAALAAAGATRFGDAIEAAVEAGQGQPIALVVALTDGASNAGRDPLDVAWRLRRQGIRLVTVGVGLPRPDDAGLRNLVVPDVVFANDLVPLRVQCVANGYEKRSTSLLVKIDGAEAARKTVTFSGRSEFQELPFKAPRAGGTHTLEVSLAPLPNEATTANNVVSRSLRVLDDRIKVLYIEGTPRWEYRYIRAVLKRDPRVDVQFITTEGDKDLARASKEHLGRFPEKEALAFQYDLVILGDVKAGTFTPTQFSLLERLVRERGASLILLAGRKHAPAEYVDTPLAAMLPVRFDQAPWEEVGDDVHPVLTADGRRSTVMALERSDARTQALWANIKPLDWVPPVTGPKPGAQVLAELSDRAERARAFPLIAWHRFGAGKCMFIGTDQLWRLRARTGDKYHLKFWGQAVQFLALSRLLGENRRVRLETGRGEYAHASGEPVEIFAHVLNDLYEPLSASTFTAYVGPADGGEPGPVTLWAVPGSPGMYHGLYSPQAPGRYQLSASTEADAGGGDALRAGLGGAGADRLQFEVLAGTAELTETSMQRDLLARMAKTTGGEYLTLRDLPLLPDYLDDRLTTEAIAKEIEVWDNGLLAGVFVGLVTLEWAWRRKKNLA